MRISDWSSDVCSSDLWPGHRPPRMTSEIEAPARMAHSGSAGEVFRAFLKLGLTSFGGPIAHLGYFRDELVVRRKWIDEAGYADLVALCQFLPGPASRSEEHTSELQSPMRISSAVFLLKQKT